MEAGKITDSYWRLLEFADPDVVYTYTNLSLDLIRRIERNFDRMEVASLQQQMSCAGCGSTMRLRVRGEWTFRLNSLLRNAIAFHGVTPVVHSLYQIRRLWTRNFFVFLPGIALYEKFDSAAAKAEVDLVCICDGKLIVGEIKQSPNDFSDDDLRKLAKISAQLGCSMVVLGCLTDRLDDLDRKAAVLRALVDPEIEVRAIPPLALGLDV